MIDPNYISQAEDEFGSIISIENIYKNQYDCQEKIQRLIKTDAGF